jgi:hypothetical protein
MGHPEFGEGQEKKVRAGHAAENDLLVRQIV